MASRERNLANKLSDGLADGRINQTAFVNETLDMADSNTVVQHNLWLFMVQYIYDRAARFRRGLLWTPEQLYIGQYCFQIAMLLDGDLHVLDKDDDQLEFEGMTE